MASNTQKTRIKRNQKRVKMGKIRKRKARAAVKRAAEAKVDIL